MEATLARRLLAESVGTALLVLFGAGSVVAALAFGKGELTYPGLGFIALAFAIVIAVVVYGFGPISGAHINPAVTFALTLTRRFPLSEAIPYMIAQLVGGAVGGFLIATAFGSSSAVPQAGGLGGTSFSPGVSYGAGTVAEALGTFLLMFAVMALAVDQRAAKGLAGSLIGLAAACAILVTGPLTGGSLNPARTFGPHLVATLYGHTVSWLQFLLYCVGPLTGAGVAAIGYDLVAKPSAGSAGDDTRVR